MPKKRHKPEEIVTKLRQADVLISQGQDIADVVRQTGVSEVACVMNCSMVKSSIRCGRPRSSSKVGGVTSTPSGRMNRWLQATGCPFRKSYPDVLMVQSGQDRNGDNSARPLDCSMQRRVFLQCQMRARLIVIRRIRNKNSPQVRLAEDDHLIQALAVQCADQAFRNAILPRRSGRDRLVTDTHRPHPTLECMPVGSVIVAHQISRR